MAAFCGCCGAEITGRAEVCVVCGTPRHGMLRRGGLQSGVLTALDPGDELGLEKIPGAARCCGPGISDREE